MNDTETSRRHPAEQFWVDNYEWLTNNGYTLRQQYRPLPNSLSVYEDEDSPVNKASLPIYVRTAKLSQVVNPLNGIAKKM
jgi:hypothetical protein